MFIENEFEKIENHSFYLNTSTESNKEQDWTVFIASRQWFSKLLTIEEDALVDNFGNNPPPKIGTLSYSGDTHDKAD